MLVSLCNLMSFTSEISCRLDFVLDTVHLTTTFVVPWKPQCQTGAASNRIVERIFKEGGDRGEILASYVQREKKSGIPVKRQSGNYFSTSSATMFLLRVT